jgi:MFS superfamily sulfate permease-like transporter
LGAILVYTGFKLVDLKSVQKLRAYGRWPIAIYASTLIMIVCADLLTGVMVGIGLSVAKLVYQMTHLEIETRREGNRTVVELIGAATFVRLPKLAEVIESIPVNEEVHLDTHRVAYIDHACLDLLEGWRRQFEMQGGKIVAEWEDIEARFAPMHSSPALAPRSRVAA